MTKSLSITETAFELTPIARSKSISSYRLLRLEVSNKEAPKHIVIMHVWWKYPSNMSNQYPFANKYFSHSRLEFSSNWAPFTESARIGASFRNEMTQLGARPSSRRYKFSEQKKLYSDLDQLYVTFRLGKFLRQLNPDHLLAIEAVSQFTADKMKYVETPFDFDTFPDFPYSNSSIVDESKNSSVLIATSAFKEKPETVTEEWGLFG